METKTIDALQKGISKLEGGVVMFTKKQMVVGFAIFIFANMVIKFIDDNYKFDGLRLVKRP